MTLQVNEVEYCKLQIHYDADPELVRSKRESIIEESRKDKKLKIPGFRPGKATKEAILQHKKNEIKQLLIQQLSQEGYSDLLFESKIKPLLNPQVSASDLNGDDFWCDMVVFKAPDFELKDYLGMSLPKPALKETLEKNVGQALENLRKQYSDLTPYTDNDLVGDGDTLTIDLLCYSHKTTPFVMVDAIDWKEEKSLSKEGILHVVGEAEELAPHLIGMKIGETKEFQLPKENVLSLFGSDFADYEIKYVVKVYMGLKAAPCSLDDSLAHKVGIENFDKLYQQVVAMISNKRSEQEKALLQNQVRNQLLADNQFKVPDWLLEDEIKHLSEKNENNLDYLLLKDKAEKTVRLSFILNAIRDKEIDIQFSNQELLMGLKEKVESQGQNGDKFLQEAQKNGSLLKMLAALREVLTIDFVISKAIIIY